MLSSTVPVKRCMQESLQLAFAFDFRTVFDDHGFDWSWWTYQFIGIDRLKLQWVYCSLCKVTHIETSCEV